MSKQPTLFDRGPRRSPRVMMHVFDASDIGPCEVEIGGHQVRLECRRCGHRTGWLAVANATEGKRGKPCPECNEGAQHG